MKTNNPDLLLSCVACLCAFGCGCSPASSGKTNPEGAPIKYVVFVADARAEILAWEVDSDLKMQRVATYRPKTAGELEVARIKSGPEAGQLAFIVDGDLLNRSGYITESGELGKHYK